VATAADLAPPLAPPRLPPRKAGQAGALPSSTGAGFPAAGSPRPGKRKLLPSLAREMAEMAPRWREMAPRWREMAPAAVPGAASPAPGGAAQFATPPDGEHGASPRDSRSSSMRSRLRDWSELSEQSLCSDAEPFPLQRNLQRSLHRKGKPAEEARAEAEEAGGTSGGHDGGAEGRGGMLPDGRRVSRLWRGDAQWLGHWRDSGGEAEEPSAESSSAASLAADPPLPLTAQVAERSLESVPLAPVPSPTEAEAEAAPAPLPTLAPARRRDGACSASSSTEPQGAISGPQDAISGPQNAISGPQDAVASRRRVSWAAEEQLCDVHLFEAQSSDTDEEYEEWSANFRRERQTRQRNKGVLMAACKLRPSSPGPLSVGAADDLHCLEGIDDELESPRDLEADEAADGADVDMSPPGAAAATHPAASPRAAPSPSGHPPPPSETASAGRNLPAPLAKLERARGASRMRPSVAAVNGKREPSSQSITSSRGHLLYQRGINKLQGR